MRCATALAALLLVSCYTPYVRDPGPPLIAEPILSVPGYVYTPYTREPRLVDVRGFDPGITLICPYTGRVFIMPDASPQLPLSLGDPRVSERRITPVRWASPPPSRSDLASRTIPAASLPAQGIPYGKPDSGRPGFVNSPFADEHQIVDVQGLTPGMPVRCPFTGKLFRVPSK